MKTFRLIGMALAAVLLSVNLTACSSDDDEPENEDGSTIVDEKKLIGITDSYDDEWTFSYNTSGKLIMIQYDDSHMNFLRSFDWTDSKITMTESKITMNGNTVFSIQNNLVEKIDNNGSSIYLVYDKNNRLTSATEIYTSSSTTITYACTWNDSKLVKLERTVSGMGASHDGTTIYEYTYSGKSCKGYSPTWGNDIWGIVDGESDVLDWGHPELFGIRTTELPDEIKVTNGYGDKNYIIQYSYTFDSEGYVTSCSEKGRDGYNDTLTYTYTWQ